MLSERMTCDTCLYARSSTKAERGELVDFYLQFTDDDHQIEGDELSLIGEQTPWALDTITCTHSKAQRSPDNVLPLGSHCNVRWEEAVEDEITGNSYPVTRYGYVSKGV